MATKMIILTLLVITVSAKAYLDGQPQFNLQKIAGRRQNIWGGNINIDRGHSGQRGNSGRGPRIQEGNSAEAQGSLGRNIGREQGILPGKIVGRPDNQERNIESGQEIVGEDIVQVPGNLGRRDGRRQDILGKYSVPGRYF